MSAESFFIKFTPQAKADLENIYNYIAYHFYDSAAAEKAIVKIENGIRRLKTMPLSAPLYDEPEYIDFNIRKLVIDRYVVFFIINNEQAQVEIIHILHGLMDSNKALKNE